MLESVDTRELVITVSSFSKILGGGWRLGWIEAGRFRKQVAELKFINTLASPSLAQAVVAEFIETGGYDRFFASSDRYSRINCTVSASRSLAIFRKTLGCRIRAADIHCGSNFRNTWTRCSSTVAAWRIRSGSYRVRFSRQAATSAISFVSAAARRLLPNRIARCKLLADSAIDAKLE